MFQQIVPQQVQPLVAPTPPQITPLFTFTTTMSVIMAVWMGAFVVQQVIKVVKREEIEKPPLLQIGK